MEFKKITELYVEVFRQLFELQPETFFTTNLGESIGLTKNPIEKGLRKVDLYGFIDFCCNNQKYIIRLDHII